MTEFSEEISAYTTPEIKQKFVDEATGKHGQQGQSKLLRDILRDRYANQAAEDVADELHVETRLESVAARLMEDMTEHRSDLDDEIGLAAIYSIAQFEALKITGELGDSEARDAIRKAKNRVHTDMELPSNNNEDTGSNSDGQSADKHESSHSEQTQTGFDMSWRDGETE